MTINDITLRSQEFVEGAKQFQDQRRDQATSEMGRSIQGMGQQLIDNRRYEQQYQMQQQRMQQELAMQQADANMRMASHQQEMQLNQIKLQQMAQIDAVDMSREQLRAMKTQNDMAELERDKQRKLFEGMDRHTKLDEINSLMKSAGGLEQLYMGGYILREDGSGLIYSPDEAKKRLGDFSNQGITREQRDRAQQISLANAHLKAFNYDAANRILSQLEGGTPPQAGGQTTPQAPAVAEKPTSPEAEAIVSGSQWAGGGIPANIANSIANLLSTQRKAFAEALRSGAESGRALTDVGDEEIVRRAITEISKSTQSPMKFSALYWLTQRGAITPEQANAMWGAK